MAFCCQHLSKPGSLVRPRRQSIMNSSLGGKCLSADNKCTLWNRTLVDPVLKPEESCCQLATTVLANSRERSADSMNRLLSYWLPTRRGAIIVIYIAITFLIVCPAIDYLLSRWPAGGRGSSQGTLHSYTLWWEETCPQWTMHGSFIQV